MSPALLVLQRLVAGYGAAISMLQVGINTTLLFGPGVLRPVPPDRLDAIVEAILGQHRRDVLNPAGLGAIARTDLWDSVE